MSNPTSILEKCTIKITWESLHTKIYDNFYNSPTTAGKKHESQKVFFEKILPDLIKDIVMNDSSRTSRFYNGTNDANNTYKKICDKLINIKKSSGEYYNYKESPIIISFKNNWEDSLCPNIEASLKKALQTLLDENITPHDTLALNERLSKLLDEDTYLVLAILSVIASTLFCFGNVENFSDTKNNILHKHYLPPMSDLENASLELQQAREDLYDDSISLAKLENTLKLSLKLSSSEKGEANYILAKKALKDNNIDAYSKYIGNAKKFGYYEALKLDNNYNAEKKLKEIYLNNAFSENRTFLTCEEILKDTPNVDSKYLREASYILYKGIRNNSYAPKGNYTAKAYLDMAIRYGHQLAAEEYNELSDNLSIVPVYTRPIVEEIGKCYSNERNKYTLLFEKTIPTSWCEKTYDFDIMDFSKDSSLFDRSNRILLLSDDFEKNLHDFLDFVKFIEVKKPNVEDFKIEIFIRHTSEKIKNIVDTALNHISEYQLPTYIIDDDKKAAENLLAFHPLFYPIHKENIDSSENITLNFIVIGDSNVCEWLVRQAFTVMDFSTYKDGKSTGNVKCRITIVSKNANALETKIKKNFPGLRTDSKDFKISGSPIIETESLNSDYDLYTTLNKIISRDKHCYFAVATESDTTNLEIATNIRELLIRNVVPQHNESELICSNSNYPIAFLCRDDYLANASKNMLVEGEVYGNQWFNNYSLIPFGKMSECYQWDKINGGIFEELAKCMHLQYSGLKCIKDYTGEEDYEIARKSTLNSYYLRQYNRENSYAIALSMPYRLFNFKSVNGKRVQPFMWNIEDSTDYSTVEHLKSLASNISNFTTEETYKNIAVWEHNRWMRVLLANGWVPVDNFNDTVFTVNEGKNPHPQLFIARMHPCICAYDDQKTLQRMLKENCDLKKDYFTYDLNNIKQTKVLLELGWFRDFDKDLNIEK
ncbi:hypothetical protein [uncultured Eubacterium sp.]|uniref:hypothetical protein n=1 Tax=uncultured Eubacterium sp. TaxID=165185 RepID=UPI002596F8B7|nr:hypothetical protein [uncultured Eubacterium sp.]